MREKKRTHQTLEEEFTKWWKFSQYLLTAMLMESKKQVKKELSFAWLFFFFLYELLYFKHMQQIV